MKIYNFNVDKSEISRLPICEYFNESVNEYLKKHKLENVEIISVHTKSKLSKDVIDNIPKLKHIITRSIGTDHIDINYCKQKNIKVHSISYSRDVICAHTWMFILNAVRKYNECVQHTQRGYFNKDCFELKDLRSMTLGIIGMGKIGYKVTKIAKSFKTKVIAYDPNKRHLLSSITGLFKYVPLNYLLQNSDIISLHCDANKSSIGMINERAIKAMKDRVILINTARGSLINEDALIKNISKFSYIGLDVVCDETDFKKDNKLLKNKNIFITPHLAYKSEDVEKEIWRKTNKIITNLTR